MIILTEVAQKLQEILNDSNNPIANGYEFVVATEGFHIDSIANIKEGRNFIPVFVSSMGGQFNPVPELKQATYSIPIVLYYPVRFKDDFYLLNEYLAEVFVGKKITYGTNSGAAISNISVAQYGELQSLDFKEFNAWLGNVYKKTIEKMEEYMSMQVTLYLSTADEGYIYGNDVQTTITVKIDDTTYSDIPVIYDDGSIQSNSQVQSEQELGTNESKGLPFGTSYGSSFRLYIKDDSVTEGGVTTDGICMALLGAWFNGNIQTLDVNLKFTIGNKTFIRKCFINSANLPIQKGQILAITLTFSPKVEDDEEDE